MITANELKIKGVSAIKNSLKTRDAIPITIRGKTEFVVMTIEEFDRLHDIELDMAILETKKDVKIGKYSTSIEDHIKELNTKSIAAEDAEDYI